MSAEDFEGIREHTKQKFDERRANALANALAADDGGWTKHTEYHWSRLVCGSRLHYWPSRNKYTLGLKNRYIKQAKDIYDFIRLREETH